MQNTVIVFCLCKKANNNSACSIGNTAMMLQTLWKLHTFVHFHQYPWMPAWHLRIIPSFCAAAPPLASLDAQCSLWFYSTKKGKKKKQVLITYNILEMLNNMRLVSLTVALTLCPSCPSCSGTPASASAPLTPRSVSAALTRSLPQTPPASPASPAAAWTPSELKDLKNH